MQLLGYKDLRPGDGPFNKETEDFDDRFEHFDTCKNPIFMKCDSKYVLKPRCTLR